LPWRKVWYGDFEPHFLQEEEWGFLFRRKAEKERTMYWIVLALVLIIGLIIYSRRKGTVKLTKDQAKMVLDLIRKERLEIDKKRGEIIEKVAGEGATLSLNEIFKNMKPESEAVEREIQKLKKSLFDKYGEKIPVDVVYRLWKELDPDQKPPWNDNPGCFERHLQRREGNLLFPPGRRIVTQKEIDEAKNRDRIEQEGFAEKVNSLASSFQGMGKDISISQVNSILKEVMKLLEERASIGGNSHRFVALLEGIEESLMQSISQAEPKVVGPLKELHSLAVMNRIPYVAQLSRKDSPILEEEQIPALLSEDLATIALEGYKSRALGPDYRPNEADIRNHLENTIKKGFSKERAVEILAAWNERKGQR
jgi:hypothetical protein